MVAVHSSFSILGRRRRSPKTPLERKFLFNILLSGTQFLARATKLSSSSNLGCVAHHVSTIVLYLHLTTIQELKCVPTACKSFVRDYTTSAISSNMKSKSATIHSLASNCTLHVCRHFTCGISQLFYSSVFNKELYTTLAVS